jgi:hypothetical protein
VSAAIIMPMRRARVAGLFLVATLLASCVPAGKSGTLAPTLTIADVGGGAIAMQNGIPVPDFGWQPRPRVELDGTWRVQRATLDPALTMSDRGSSLAAIEEEAGGRQQPDYDDGGWADGEVPGTNNPPPGGEEGGAWYRRHFTVPRSWNGQAVSLRIGSANYVADAWLNGTWLGYHEGGSTPFAFDVGMTLRPGGENVIAIRVHTIPLGTRSDTVPWGIIDWWNYGGLTGPVWLEAAPPAHLVRADVFPHLDALDIEVAVARSTSLAGVAADAPPVDLPDHATVRHTIYPATVNDRNLADPDPRALVPDGALPLAVVRQEVSVPDVGEAVQQAVSVLFGEADAWSPSRPALYVLRAQLLPPAGTPPEGPPIPPDELWTTFGIRHVAVDPERPAVLLNGEPAFFRGVGLHQESLTYAGDGSLAGGTPVETADALRAEMEQARAIGADLVRTGHLPADPTLLMLADRLGFAVWEEIPLYHATPLIFERTMGRGLPQQMVREMALRDMNHPSVLFHGFANESTGEDERSDALGELVAVDREIDGTRLTGQAAYGWRPDDPTQAPLDVAGFTMYQGVFYGDDPDVDTRRALLEAHRANPEKPIVILEFGRWADNAADEVRQGAIFDATYPAIARFRAERSGGFVSGATWWALNDFATQLGLIEVEHFGLYRPDGTMRPAGRSAADAFRAPAGRGSELNIDPDIERPRVRPEPAIGDWTLVGYLAYALALSSALIGSAVLILTRRGGRAVGRRP